MMLRPGDKVISDLYGEGTVAGESKCVSGVVVDFKAGPRECVYHCVTGQRHPKCGTDKITKVEEAT